MTRRCKILRHWIMHSSAVSSSPLIADCTASSGSTLSGTFSIMVSIRPYAAFLTGIPSSTLCLKQPRSTSLIREGSIAVNLVAYYWIFRASPLTEIGEEWVIAVSDSNTLPLTVISESLVKSIKSKTLIWRSMGDDSLEAPNLNDFETVALSKAEAEFNDLESASEIS